MPSRNKLPKKTAAEDVASMDGLSDFTELVKSKIISNKLKELAENMELVELRHLVAWMTALRNEREASAEKKKDPLQRLRATKKVW
jgi:hypothetical protein